MHILFVDESGTPPPPTKERPRYFVVGGIIVPEGAWHGLRDGLFGMKVRRKIRGEFKWRYFAPANDQPENPMRNLAQTDRDAIRTELYRIIVQAKAVRTLASVCSVSSAYKITSVNEPDERNDDRWFSHLEPSLRRGPKNQIDGYGIVKVPKRDWI